MGISERTKALSNKIEENKAQYDLERLTAKILVLSSENVSKDESLTRKYVSPEKDLLEKVATMKRFEYSSLCKVLKEQTEIAKKMVSKIRQHLRVS